MLNNSELREKARFQLGGGIFKTQWLLMLVAILIVLAVDSILSPTVVGLLVVMGPMEYGLFRVAINCATKKQDIDFKDMITGFTEDFGQNVLLGLISEIFIFLWSLLFVIPGIVKSYSYSMAFYIKQENKAKDWKYCLDESTRMMNGYKMKLFCLDLSFLGWYILGAIAFGVGILFVIPYHLMARTNFYIDISESKLHNGEI